MSNEEFRELQDKIGCQGIWLARMFEVQPLTITRYRNKDKIPGSVALAMKALASGWRP